MIRHIVIAALRNMAANRLQTVIAIGGLSIGIAAALLMALVIHNQLSLDSFIPGHARTFMLRSEFRQPGSLSFHADNTPVGAATLVKLTFPQVEATTRLMAPRHISNKPVVTLRHGLVMADEPAYWADANMFDVLPLPVFRGDIANALRRPDGLVLPRAIARKYFGHDDAVGQPILVDGHPMTVTAVIEDLPVNATSLKSGIFIAGQASFSPMMSDLSRDMNPLLTYMRLRPHVSAADLDGPWQRLIDGRFRGPPGQTYAILRMPLSQSALLIPGAAARLAVMGLTGALILFLAAINFVNLLTARATCRAREVAVRKVCGAPRPVLVAQFLGESIITVLFATCVAATLCEWLLPPINVLLGTGATMAQMQSPQALGLLLGGIVVLGLAAGAWPALVLSSFRPAGVLKGTLAPNSLGDLIRKELVVLQFAILIGLAVAAAIVWQQERYATREGLHANIDHVLVLRGGCKPAFRAQLRKLPGVAGAACADISLFEGADEAGFTDKGVMRHANVITFDPGVLALYGLRPLAGSLPPPSAEGDRNLAAPPRLVLNVAAAKMFGFASPQAAIGRVPPGYKAPPLPGRDRGAPGMIVAVIPDFSFDTITNVPITPTFYTSSLNPFGNDDDMVSIKLRDQQIPETLDAIDRLWPAFHPGLPVSRFFLDAYMQERYVYMLRQAQLFTIFSGVAVFLACLGLLGLSISTAERRTKEIGVRKAMGADNRQIVALLLWQFAQPVLWANALAWPTAWWLMRRWLSGFAYHIDLHWWVFAAASMATLVIALATVTAQALLTARQKPVLALRTE